MIDIKDSCKIKLFFDIMYELDKYFNEKIKYGKTKIEYYISDTKNSVTINFIIIYNKKRFIFTRIISQMISCDSLINIKEHIYDIINDVSNKFNKNILSIINKETNNLSDDTIITVCDKCLHASCWNGEFRCEDAYNAGTIEKTVGELKKLNLEHEDNWRKQLIISGQIDE